MSPIELWWLNYHTQNAISHMRTMSGRECLAAIGCALFVVLAMLFVLYGPPYIKEWVGGRRLKRILKKYEDRPPSRPGSRAQHSHEHEGARQRACQSSHQGARLETLETCEMSCQSPCETMCQATHQTAGKESPQPKPKPKTETRTQELARTHRVHQLLLFTGDGAGSCSMACDYCFLAKEGPLRIMSPETLQDAIAFLEGLTDQPSLHFFGTEPTMQWDLIVEARRLRPGWPISLTTNGLLLTPERIDWMADNDVKVYVYSIDGGALHNRHRRDVRGRWTWGRVAGNLRYLVQSQGDWVTARATWMPDDYDLAGRFRALEALGARSIQVVPDIETGVEWDEQRVEQAYLELGEHYAWGRTPSRFVDEMVDAIATGKVKPGYPCNFGRGCWTVMPDGELRACQRGERIGSIYEGVADAAPLYESALCSVLVNGRDPLKPECSDCVAFERCPGVGYCSAANRTAGNPAIPTEAHCQHLRGMVRACTVWAERRPKSAHRVIQEGVLGVVYDATQESA